MNNESKTNQGKMNQRKMNGGGMEEEWIMNEKAMKNQSRCDVNVRVFEQFIVVNSFQ
jgi:hypothetical protein